MTKFRKRPLTIEAQQFLAPPGKHPVPAGMKLWPDENGFQPRDLTWGYVDTPEGRMHVMHGDWIIRGIKGEYYPCKDDIFRATYETVEESPAPAPSAVESFEAFAARAAAAGVRELWLSIGSDGPRAIVHVSPLSHSAADSERASAAGIVTRSFRVNGDQLVPQADSFDAAAVAAAAEAMPGGA